MFSSRRMSLVTLVRFIIILVSMGLACAGPINHHRSRDASSGCEHARNHFFLPHIRHGDMNSRPMANLCPGKSGSCCQGLELAIEHKTREQFGSSLTKHVSTFRSQFEQHSAMVKHRVFSILDDTVHKIRTSGNDRDMSRSVAAAEVIFDDIRENLAHLANYRSNKPVPSLDLEESSLGFIKAVVIDILEKDFVSFSLSYPFFSDIFSYFSLQGKKFPVDLLDCLHEIDFDDFQNLNKLSEKMHRSLHFAYETSR